MKSPHPSIRDLIVGAYPRFMSSPLRPHQSLKEYATKESRFTCALSGFLTWSLLSRSKFTVHAVPVERILLSPCSGSASLFHPRQHILFSEARAAHQLQLPPRPRLSRRFDYYHPPLNLSLCQRWPHSEPLCSGLNAFAFPRKFRFGRNECPLHQYGLSSKLRNTDET